MARIGLWGRLLPAKPGRPDRIYRQRDEREAFISAKAETDVAERARMYGQLELKVTVREAGEADIARVADLINRTNQFNMAGSRVTRREVEQWVASADARVLIADAADRFGSMGTIAVLIAVRAAGRIEVPVFVLSCRVFGYGMEFAILGEALRLAEPDQAVFGQFSETEHTSLAAKFTRPRVFPRRRWLATSSQRADQRSRLARGRSGDQAVRAVSRFRRLPQVAGSAIIPERVKGVHDNPTREKSALVD